MADVKLNAFLMVILSSLFGTKFCAPETKHERMKRMRIKASESPCFGCTFDTGRCVGCHGTCKKYIEFRNAYKAEKEKQKDDTYYSQTKEKIMRHNQMLQKQGRRR